LQELPSSDQRRKNWPIGKGRSRKSPSRHFDEREDEKTAAGKNTAGWWEGWRKVGERMLREAESGYGTGGRDKVRAKNEVR